MTRAKFPIGTEVRYVESGQEAEIVSIDESDAEDYESDTDVFVRMNGQVIQSDVSRLEFR